MNDLSILPEMGFYLGFTLVLLTALAFRNHFSNTLNASKWAGFALVVLHGLLVVIVFFGVFVHDHWFGMYIRAIENKWVGLVLVFSPMIWAGFVAALYNRIFGR